MLTEVGIFNLNSYQQTFPQKSFQKKLLTVAKQCHFFWFPLVLFSEITESFLLKFWKKSTSQTCSPKQLRFYTLFLNLYDTVTRSKNLQMKDPLQGSRLLRRTPCWMFQYDVEIFITWMLMHIHLFCMVEQVLPGPKCKSNG